ncbi:MULTISPECIES: NAD-dependent epimerase/dehydratase family protein [Streptomyces]|uniref:SDR family oxidoreductase n=1 Tax=Streptomyces griseofuscus TaxID=146922 RepID=A0A7H1QCW6_9ACTN|nr:MULTISPECIES: NAD-dependent epimerase/dehydratase family protein [Streptomyces]MBA9050676.1 nucleoside-diphosphate-sugar epimerase [Streptomyces murinus]QNT98146.1 SDR family oxidoreductase [Streptomyces griseofuscus]
MAGPLSPGTGRDTSRRPLIVVLGASGYIGSAVVRELACRPVRLRAVARGPFTVPAGGRAETAVMRTDLTAPDAVAEAVRGADAVIHLVARMTGRGSWRSAASDPQTERVNVDLVREVVERCAAPSGGRPAPTVVLASTNQVTDGGPPRSAYARQKAAAERHLLDAALRGTVRGIALRLPTTVGSEAGVAPAMAGRALAGEALTLWHDGAVRREFLDVTDAARALVTALDHAADLDGRACAVGGHVVGLGELFRAIAASAARHTGRPPVPVRSVAPPEYAETGDFHDLRVDSSAFRDVTGWRPEVPLSRAVDDVVAAVARRRAPAR